MAPALQISIPTTSTTTPSSGKPYTVYHVTLQLPLRRHQVRKRYTDFVNLHESLLSQTGAPPPAPLPAKSWLRRTVNNDALTEERRKGLEKYLRGILEAEDARWRSCSAWRAFLNLPSGTTTSEGGSGSGAIHTRTRSGGESGGITDPNLWLDVHRELKTQIQTARQQLKQREAATTPQQQHALSAEAKASLVRAATSIAQLDDGLRRMSSPSGNKSDVDRAAGWSGNKSLGDGEIRRRRDLLGAARKEVEGLEGLLKSMASSTTTSLRAVNGSAATSGAAQPASSSDKEALWRGTGTASSAAGHPKPGGRVLGGAPLKETERTREVDNAGVLQLQQQIMQEQEEDVLSLGQTVARLKDMGIVINEELTIQNEMLGVLEEDAGRVQGKIDVARKRIGKIS